MITMPKVELLAQELATGKTPVQLFESFTRTIAEYAADQDVLDELRAEFKARIQFAWELSRAASIRNRKGDK
jgi:hypothetical protein